MKFILTDIEGTTTSINFVHDELFPYSEKRMKDFVVSNLLNTDVQSCLNLVKKTIIEEESMNQNQEINLDQIILQLKKWIKQDRKHPALKTLQGMIWKVGYELGEIKGHLYEDVLPALIKWKESSIQLAVYSSGSVQAQHLIFKHSIKGDLKSYFTHFFDTAVGNKREITSYQNIAKALQTLPSDILFLSDIKEELDAAHAVGFQTIQLVRNDKVVIGNHKTVKNFSEI